MAFRGMAVYTYPIVRRISHISGNSTRDIMQSAVPGPSLLRTGDGTTFQAVPSDPGTNLGLVGNALSAATGRRLSSGVLALFVVAGSIEGGGLVFASADPLRGQQQLPVDYPAGHAGLSDGCL